MKKLHILTATAIAALSLSSAADVFIIERTNGDVLELNVETIKEMRFKQEMGETGNLAPETVEIIDLGLSVCWASYNVGATSIEEKGTYVMWGGLEPQSRYSWSFYPFGMQQALTKYNANDGLVYLQPEDDYATREWGTDWRMPTQEEANELIENCEIEMNVEENGVKGVRLYSKVPGYEGTSIFFPSNGYMFDNCQNLYPDEVYLWTNTVGRGLYQFAMSISLKPSGEYAGLASVLGMYRCLGENVRAVYTKKNTTPVSEQSVDLGLSVKWGVCNVGATTEEQIGDYFAWGATAPQESYDWASYPFGTSATAVTKYGKNDKITTLEPSDDAATVNLGEQWRTPTQEEVQELIQNCSIYAEELNGVKGFRFTSKVDGYEGKSIFMPVCGEMHGTGVSNGEAYLDIWTSTLAGTSLMTQGKAYGLQVSLLNTGDAKISSADRCYGRPVRGVIAK